MYPDEFMPCDGSAEISKGVVIGQQKRSTFGLSYVTKIGNDTDGSDYGYKIHLIYGAKAKPSEKGYETINDSPDAIALASSEFPALIKPHISERIGQPIPSLKNELFN